MKIGVVSSKWWAGACGTCGIEGVELPPPGSPPAGPRSADLNARLAVGRRALDALGGESIGLILDHDATGLTFVEGPGGLSELKLTHEMAGVPLVSHCSRPVATLLHGLPWPVAWQTLQSKTWIKALTDPVHVEELRSFGIGNVVYLPPGALEFDYDTRPLDGKGVRVPVSFVGDAAVSPPMTGPGGIGDWIGRVASVLRSPGDGATFYEIYHTLYDRAEPPVEGESLERRAEKAAD